MSPYVADPVYLNGRFLPLAEAGISPLDRGFLYGDGVYELIPVYSRRPFRIDEHLKRLQATLDGIKLANPLPLAEWKSVVLKLIEKRDNVKQLMVEQTRARHILVRLNEIIGEAEARRRLDEIREKVVAGGDFAEFARAQSEDASSMKGGDLGWLSPGDTVPEFEKAMDALKLGEVSPPVQSPFGWHLIQVQERRTADMTKERERQLARQALRGRKTDEAFTGWVRQQRDRAFVEYRLEER